MGLSLMGPSVMRLHSDRTLLGIVNHETRPPSASRTAQASIADWYAASKATGSAYSLAAQPDRDRQRRDGEQRAGPGDGVVDPAGDAGVLVGRRGEHRRRQRRDHQRQAEPEDGQAGKDVGPVVRVRADAAAAAAMPTAITSGPTVIGIRGPIRAPSSPPLAARSSMQIVIGSVASAGLEGAVPADGLELEHQEEEQAPRAAYTSSVIALAALKVRSAKMPSGSIGCRSRRSTTTNATAATRPATPAHGARRVAQLDQGVGDAAEGERREQRAR